MDFHNFHLSIYQTPVAMEYSDAFELVYEFWKKTWRDVFQEIGKPSEIRSDDLTRQHEILVLYHGERPIAMVCHRYVNLGLRSTLEDSYFSSAWTKEDCERVRAIGGFGVIGSQILVDPEYRKSHRQIPTKQLISLLSLEQVQRAKPDLVIGTMRVDKGMNKLFYEAGATSLAKKIPYYGAEVDLVCFFPKINPIKINPEFKDTISSLLNTAKIVKQRSAA